MNKTAIKNFAVWARRKLISDITYKASMLGVTDSGIAEPLPISTKDLQFFDIGTKDYAEVSGNEIKQRDKLADAIKKKEKNYETYKEAFEYIVEEVAYTWFNRLIAIRFMEVNNYLPSGVRVLSSENPAKSEPDFITTPFDTDLDFTSVEQDKVMQLKDENKLDELFRMLFIKQCNKLHEILPELFEKTDDYTELLLTISFTDKDGVVYHLVHDIEEKDFNVAEEGQVEIIGWLYQYYNTEPKDTVFANLKKNIKISKDHIPAATQLFTPDWIVRYMVENSLGKLYIDKRRTEGIYADGRGPEEMTWSENENVRIVVEQEIASVMGWKYYLPEAEQTPEVRAELNSINLTHITNFKVENIKIIDPCMGSGHILVYAFDVLMQIYESSGYTQRDAARSILKNNLYGIDIDYRAYQLAYFAVMMKGRQYDRRFFTGNLVPNLAYSTPVYYSSKANLLGDKFASYLDNCAFAEKAGLGSLRNETYYTAENIDNILKNCDAFQYDIFDRNDIILMCQAAANGLKLTDILSQHYDIVVTNPPYMSSSGMSLALSKYLKDHYPDSKSDLFAAFIERCGQLTKKNGYYAMITQHSWMFLSSFEKLRAKLLNTVNIVTMAHLGARAFEEIGGEVVQTTSFVIRKNYIANYKGEYCRLIEPVTQQGKEEMFLTGTNRYIAKQEDFSKIPSSPIAYWASEKTLKAYSSPNLRQLAEPRHGLATSNNNLFLKKWYEVSIKKCSVYDLKNHNDYKWVPMNKGGSYRKWYGNNEWLINYENDGFEIKKYAADIYKSASRTIQNTKYYFKQSLTWSALTSGNFSVRWSNEGAIFGSGGYSAFVDEEDIYYILALMNSKVNSIFIKIVSPTLNYEVGHIKTIPVVMENATKDRVNDISKKLVRLSQNDWDSFETSWDFKKHPLVEYASFTPQEIKRDREKQISDMGLIRDAYELWSDKCEGRFNQLKANEEELNRIFIDIYGLQDELTPEVEDKDVTVRKADLQREIKSLISYAVGCMFGRYSIYKEGLIYAGGEFNCNDYENLAWQSENKPEAKEFYNKIHFVPDMDNCIPVTDEEYFEDDIVGRFVEFLSTVYGEETLEENLDFIAKALGNKGNTSREVIRNYFLNDFIKDHIKIYQKRPIYWLYDSGKQNGFKALIYMHRYNADTTGNMRVEYLHRMQTVYEKELERMQEIVDNSSDNREISAANKRKEKLQKQLKETKEYDSKVAHLALSRIDIDLDDGVKVNYEKVQTASDGTKLSILTKI